MNVKGQMVGLSLGGAGCEHLKSVTIMQACPAGHGLTLSKGKAVMLQVLAAFSLARPRNTAATRSGCAAAICSCSVWEPVGESIILPFPGTTFSARSGLPLTCSLSALSAAPASERKASTARRMSVPLAPNAAL